jgi:8-oxo-dGTP diphosphatase
MLLRNKKPDDIHRGKWNGLGGKLEPGESPEMCVRREVKEEAGIDIDSPKLRGILTFPAFGGRNDWVVFVFTATIFSGTLIDSPEGRLAWIKDEELLKLPLWEGDRIFMEWLHKPGIFSAVFKYEAGTLLDWSVVWY